LFAAGTEIGKYTKEGKPIPIPRHSITFAVLGAFILWFGWFGFNPGSTLSAHELRISVIAVNTNLCAAAAAMTAIFITWKKFGKADVVMTVNGAVAGLVVALHCIALRCVALRNGIPHIALHYKKKVPFRKGTANF